MVAGRRGVPITIRKKFTRRKTARKEAGAKSKDQKGKKALLHENHCLTDQHFKRNLQWKKLWL
jgi:hypothetical protein